jgi:hypothetical protein
MTGPLDKLRTIAAALPETKERVSHGQPTWFVAGKQFAQFRNNHHGDGKCVVCVKTSGPDEQAILIEGDPETYSRPAYLGPSGWVSVNLSGDAVDWDHVGGRLATSWNLAAPARFRQSKRS